MALARARRQIEVFDIAIVAVVTKALGAFIVLVIILMPYYRSDPTQAPVVQAVEDYLGAIRRDVEAAQRRLNEPNPDRTALDQLFEQAKSEIAKAQGMIQGVRDKLDQAKAQIDRLEARDTELQNRAAQLEAELGRAQAEVARLQQTNKDLTADNERVRAADEALKSENQDLRKRMQDMERQVAAAAGLKDQNAALQQQVSALEQDIQQERNENNALQEKNQSMNEQMEKMQQRAVGTEDPTLVMRWFSVGLILPECSDIDFVLYVRWDGRLRNATTGGDMPEARPFMASLPEQRTPLLGHRYFDLGTKGDTGSLGEKALQQEGLLALGRTQTQIKMFQAVSRAEGSYSVYLVAKDPQAFRQRQCAVHPYYLSWTGATLGQKIVLSQKRPYAWLRRFRVNKDGTNTLGVTPKDDDEFQTELEGFSKQQSAALCTERRICGTEDAHRFALQASQKARAAP